jgi:hypothetical protein
MFTVFKTSCQYDCGLPNVSSGIPVCDCYPASGQIWCANKQLTEVPIFPQNFWYLDLSNNFISDFDSKRLLNFTVVILHNNPLNCTLVKDCKIKSHCQCASNFVPTKNSLDEVANPTLISKYEKNATVLTPKINETNGYYETLVTERVNDSSTVNLLALGTSTVMYNTSGFSIHKYVSQPTFCHSVSLIADDFNCLHLILICVGIFLTVIITAISCFIYYERKQKKDQRKSVFELEDINMQCNSMQVNSVKFHTL